MASMQELSPRQIADRMVKTLDDKKAQDLRLLEISELTVMADFFVIATGTSTTHVKSLADEVEQVLKQQGIEAHHTEGYLSGGWVLLDFGSVIAHIFLKDVREFYTLERMWGDARHIDIAEIVAE